MGEGCGPFREKQACRFSVNILFSMDHEWGKSLGM